MNAIPAQINVRTRPVVKRAAGAPITSGTVNYYLIALTGDNAGKWFRDSDDTWQAAEAICGAMTHKADGHWSVSVASAAWIDGVEYIEYAKESGDLHTPVSKQFRCAASPNVVVPDKAGTAATLHGITDAAIATRSSHDTAAVVTALFTTSGITADGTATFQDIIKALYSSARGKIVKTGDSYAYRNDDDTATLFTLTIASGERSTA